MVVLEGYYPKNMGSFSAYKNHKISFNFIHTTHVQQSGAIIVHCKFALSVHLVCHL